MINTDEHLEWQYYVIDSLEIVLKFPSAVVGLVGGLICLLCKNLFTFCNQQIKLMDGVIKKTAIGMYYVVCVPLLLFCYLPMALLLVLVDKYEGFVEFLIDMLR